MEAFLHIGLMITIVLIILIPTWKKGKTRKIALSLSAATVLGVGGYLAYALVQDSNRDKMANQLYDIKLHNMNAIYLVNNIFYNIDNNPMVANSPYGCVIWYDYECLKPRPNCKDIIEATRKSLSRDTYDNLLKTNALLMNEENKIVAQIQAKDTTDLLNQIHNYHAGLQKFNEELDLMMAKLRGSNSLAFK